MSVTVLDIEIPTHPIPGVNYVQGTILNSKLLSKLVKNVDIVYHFAAIVSVPLCQANPRESTYTNYMGTCEVLDAIAKENSKRSQPVRMVFTSSSAVYGDSPKKSQPIQEDADLTTSGSFYAAQKLHSEHTIKLYQEAYGVPAMIFRLFNVYGPGQDPCSPYSGVITLFSTAISENRPILLNGGGTQARDFVSVHDVADACALVAKLPEIEFNAESINLGSGTAISIKNLATLMFKTASHEVPMLDSPPRLGDIHFSLANISKAQRLLDWTPRVSLREGLMELDQLKRRFKAA